MLRDMYKKSTIIGRSVVALAVLGMASFASAATELQFDINAVTISASPTVTIANLSTYTGTITISDNSQSFLEGILIDPDSQPISGTLTAVSGTMNYVGGAIASSPASNLTFTIENSDSSLHTYTGSFDDLTLSNNGITSPLFFSQADANPSHLDSDDFAGVDVSQWANQDLDGAAIVSNFPGSTGNLDVFILPEPAIGLIGLAALASLRIRGRRA
jgi:hypothetical protein